MWATGTSSTETPVFPVSICVPMPGADRCWARCSRKVWLGGAMWGPGREPRQMVYSFLRDWLHSRHCSSLMHKFWDGLCSTWPPHPHVLPRACSLDPRWAPLSLRYPGTLSHLCGLQSTSSCLLPQRQFQAWGGLKHQVQVPWFGCYWPCCLTRSSGSSTLVFMQMDSEDSAIALSWAEFVSWVTAARVPIIPRGVVLWGKAFRIHFIGTR